jgi:two-component system, sensor histidine kinase LadS
MRYFCLLLLSLLPLVAGAVAFDENTRSLPLGEEMAVFEDVRGAVNIADASSAALAEAFHRHNKPVLNAGYSRSAFWLRLDLDYRPIARSGQQPWLLELAYPPLDQIDLYLADDQGGFQLVQRTGDSLPFASRPMAQNNYVFALNLQPNQPQRLYIRVQSQGSVIVPLTLWSPTAYLEELPGRIYVLGIIYGVLLVMLLYNLFIFISVRDRSYFYYIVYIAAFGLYQVSVNGAGIQYFWPNNPWWANAATPFLIGLAAIAGCQFARSFLHTREHSPWIDRLLMLLMACGLLTMLLALLASYAVALRLATALALLFTVIILLAGILAWRRGLRVARYFVFAWSAFLLGGMVNTLMVLGLLPNTFLTMYASQIGSALEVGLLSLALADRINVMKEERAGLLQQNARELEVLNRELAISNRLKDEFLATVTHELRTPMNGVIGSLELMQTLSLDIEIAQYQKTAATSARDMMRMVNDILALTELQAGKLHAQNSMFSLRAWLDSVRVRYAPQAAAKGLNLRLELDEKIPDTLQGDGAKLSQCVGYLLDNAIKFTATGTVTLRIKRNPAGKGLLGLHIEVQDSGVGFNPDLAAPLYQRFQQLDGSLTREYGGLGVGLAICRQLIELLGGSLKHQSQPGQGSCFSLSLELDLLIQASADAVPAQRPQGPQLRTPAQCLVLVVEDNAINQLVLRGMLLKLGYQVRCVDNGAAALDSLRNEPIDAVLLDCQMPGMDGFATCRALRLLPGCSELPVLAVTAHSHAGDRERCLAAGMSDYLTKPLKFDTLQVVLHDWLLCTAPL